MIGTIVLLIVIAAAAKCQESSNPLGTITPSQQNPSPFLDLFTGASFMYPDDMRKTYGEPSTYRVSCPKSDTLSSAASVLGSAAKIMLAAAALVFLKLMGAKMMLIPLTTMVLAKVGLKAILLWPMISKMIKYFKKKKKKKASRSRTIKDCSQRVACVIQRSMHDGFGGSLGTAFTFTMIEDVEDDSSFAKMLLDIVAGEKVSKCLDIECSSGIDIS